MARIEIHSIRDFRGGLNLRTDAHLLKDDESPDLINVDVDPAGGVRQRKGVLPFGGNLGGRKVLNLWEYTTTTGAKQVILSTDQGLFYSTGGNPQLVSAARTSLCRSATFKGRNYIQNGSSAVLRWDGLVATQLQGTVWNNNIEVPTASGAVGAMPPAKFLAPHMGMMWLGNTREGGISYPNRVRHSHPNFPEDWRAEDFIDIDTGLDGDEITAIVPYDDKLLVFKKRSIYAVYGHSPETFQVIPVTREVGAISQEAIVTSDQGVYFFSWPEGVFLYNQKGLTWQFERIYPALQDGRIPHQEQEEIQLGWGFRRVWVSVPWLGSEGRDRVFVLDPTLGKNGSWVLYDLSVGPFLEFNPPGENAALLAASADGSRLLRLEQDVPYDSFAPGVQVPIVAKFRTRWVDLGEHSVPKRWKRPEVVLRSGTGAAVDVTCYQDYDPTRARRTFVLNSQPIDAPAPLGWGANWGTMKWTRSETATSSKARNEIERGSPLGNARAVSLQFEARTSDEEMSDWGINSITFKYQPRKVKN